MRAGTVDGAGSRSEALWVAKSLVRRLGMPTVKEKCAVVWLVRLEGSWEEVLGRTRRMSHGCGGWSKESVVMLDGVIIQRITREMTMGAGSREMRVGRRVVSGVERASRWRVASGIVAGY